MTRLATVAVNRCILLPLFAPPAPPLAGRLRRFVLRFCCLVELTFPLDSEPLGAVIRPSARAVRHGRPESRDRSRAYWTLAVSEAAAFRVKVQVGVLAPPLL